MAAQPTDIPIPPNKPESGFRKLVRSLSRSSPRTQAPPRDKSLTRATSRERGESQKSPGLSRSPPPDSYFPPPPRETLKDSEANGRSRHPESLGARAADIGASSQGAPGVSFAPSSNATRAPAELDTWAPPPRRTQSQRVPRVPSDGPPLSRSNGGRSRAGTLGDAFDQTNGTGEDEARKEVRRGVQLEDKPLSRRSPSVRRAASAVRRAVESVGFVPADKVEGEKRVLILVADGSEEIEVITPMDVFVRASLGPVLVSVSPEFSPSQSLPYITLSRGARMLADTKFETLKQEYKDDFDAVIIPGGAKGAERLSKDIGVQQLIQSFHASGKLVGMICAGSLAAKSSGIALGEPITSHPSVKGDLEKHYQYSEERVVISNNLVTSRGPGTAIEFSLAIVELLAGKRKRDEVAGPMML